MAKILRSITLDFEVDAEIRLRNINISNTINNLLKAYLDMDEEEPQELPANIKEAEVQVAKLSGILQEAQKNKNKIKRDYEDRVRKSKEKDDEQWVDH